MGTPATIKVNGVKYAKIYKHWDGYPSATLPWLEKFNKEFAENRGVDPDYKFAQLLRSSVRMQEEFNLDDSEYTGWGTLPYDCEAGESYEFILNDDGSVDVIS